MFTNYEIHADAYEELKSVLHEDLIEEINWAFTCAFSEK